MVPLVKPLEVVSHYCTSFTDVFSKKEIVQLQRYLSGLLISPNKTVEGINRLFIFDVQDQSTLNRFLTDSDFDVGKLNTKRVKWMQECPQTAFKHSEGDKGVLILDDTLLTHYGSHFEKIAWLYDHVNKNHSWAHCLVNLHYSDDQTDYPIDFCMWEPADIQKVEKALVAIGYKLMTKRVDNKEKDPSGWRKYLLQAYSYQRSKQEKERNGLEYVYQSKIDLSKKMLGEFFKNYPGTNLPISFDYWYTCEELCKYIHEDLKQAYVGTLKEQDILIIGPKQEKITCGEFAKQLVEQHQKDVKEGKRPIFEKIGIHYKGEKEQYWVYCQTHQISKLGKQRLVISYSKEDLSSSPCFYISNQMHWRGGGIMRIRRHRWPVEVYHEEGKAEGLEKYQIRQFNAIIKHVACVSLTYSMLKRVQFDEALLNKLNWKPSKICSSLAFWRRILTADAILALIEWASGKPVKDNQELTKALESLIQAYR